LKTSTLALKTVTIGLKAKKALLKNGIKSEIVKIDSHNSQNGCQYGIRFNERNYFDVVAILREQGIEYGAYREK
jgi:hypothetical protein